MDERTTCTTSLVEGKTFCRQRYLSTFRRPSLVEVFSAQRAARVLFFGISGKFPIMLLVFGLEELVAGLSTMVVH